MVTAAPDYRADSHTPAHYPTTETKGWHRTTPAGNILFADNHIAVYQGKAAANLNW
jgi:prepilin-type processing-associated H-X9-DG protein